MTAVPLIEIEGLRVVFHGDGGRTTHAVDSVDLSVANGATLGLVGESGCGKSVTSLAIMGLLPKGSAEVSGSVRFDGFDLLHVPDQTLRDLYDLLKWAPTSANAAPARFAFLRSKEAKERLRPALAPLNVEKTMSAPVTVIARVAARLWILAQTSTIAAPSAVRCVRSPGETMSLGPAGRTVTGRSMPPKLNHERCQPACFIAVGAR